MVLRNLDETLLQHNGARGVLVDFGYRKRARSGSWVTSSGRYTVKVDGPEGKLVEVGVGNLERGGGGG